MVPLFMAGMVLATLWLSLYVYLLFSLGRSLAVEFRLRVSKVAATAILATASSILALPALLLPLDSIYRLTIVFGIWLVHTQSTAVGYWSTSEKLREEDEERWERTAEAWIDQFEEDVPIWLRDFEDEP